MLLAIIIFAFSPPTGIALLGIFLLRRNTDNSRYIYLFSFLLSVFLGLINTTKALEGDLSTYEYQFLETQYYSFTDYMSSITKEHLFYAANYACYILFDGSFKGWIFLLSFVSYFIYFASVIKYSNKMFGPTPNAVFTLIIAAFLPQLFSLSGHLLRQFLAASIFMYYMVNRIFYDKNHWWLAIIGILIHTSSMLMFFLAYLPFLKGIRSPKNIVYILLVIAGINMIQITVSHSSALLGGHFGIIDYIIDRIKYVDITTSSGMGVLGLFFMGVAVGISLFYYKLDFNTEVSDEYQHLVHLLVITSVFVLINLQQTEFSLRFYFYLYFFAPLVVALLFHKETPVSSAGRYCTAALLFVYFIYQLDHGVWHYAESTDILTRTIIGYFIF